MEKMLFARSVAILAVLLVVAAFLGGCTSNQPIAASNQRVEDTSPGLNQPVDAPSPELVHKEPVFFTFQSDITYASYNGQSLELDLYQEEKRAPPLAAQGAEPIQVDQPNSQPVIIWLPRYGKDERAADYNQFQEVPGVWDKFPTPVAFYVGYHYTVVSVQYADAGSKTEALNSAVAYLTDNANTLKIDAANIGVLQATESGYTASIIRQGKVTKEADNPLTIADSVNDFTKLQSAESTKVLITFFENGLGGGAYDAEYDPVVQLNDPEDSWIDQITNTYPGSLYRLFPTPARGVDAIASYMIYLPQSYDTSNKRYPVLYFLHGGSGSQREVQWLINIMDPAMKAGKMPEAIIVGVEALPGGWYTNANIGAPGVTSGLIEDVIIKDLIPHIDATYRTIDDPKARGLEGYSAGGYGAMRLAFKFPELFGATSSYAGAVVDWQDERNVGTLTGTFGPNEPASIELFNATRPQAYAQQNAAAIKGNVAIRVVVGDQDWLYNDGNGKNISKNFSDLLSSLEIPHEYSVVPGADHSITDQYSSGIIPYPIEFWQKAFDPFK